MRSEKPIWPWVLTVIALLSLVVYLGFHNYAPDKMPTIGASTCNDKASVLNIMDSWGESYGNPNGATFTNWVYNFGGVEAKNITLKCVIMDEQENLVKAVDYNFGNLASYSYKYDEVYMNYRIPQNVNYTAICFINGCDNCDILIDKLPDINELNNKFR